MARSRSSGGEVTRPPRARDAGALRGGAFGLLVVFAPACASFSTHLTPRPTAKGATELDAHVDVLAATKDDGGRFIFPNLEMAIRYGLSDTVDIGGKFNAFGAELNSRVLLLSSDALDLGIVPSAGFTAAGTTVGHTEALIGTFGLPLLAGIHAGDAATIIIGAKLHAHLATGVDRNDGDDEIDFDTAEVAIYPGGVVGLHLLLSESFALFPEINFLFPYLPDDEKFAKPVWQGGVAFQFRVST